MEKDNKLPLKLSGTDGNAFAILGLAKKTMERAKTPKEEIEKFLKEAKSGDYDHLLQTTMEWFSVD